MKIRIKGNSIRFRLTKTDVALLYEKGQLTDQTDFVGQRLVYRIQSTTEMEEMMVMHEQGKIVLFMSSKLIHDLAKTDKVGFDNHEGPVSILIEKDFACLDNTIEDQSDNYPNPSSACAV